MLELCRPVQPGADSALLRYTAAMSEAVYARMLDAALPFVAGRSLRCEGLDDAAAGALAAFADASASERVVVARGHAPALAAGELLVLLLPGATSAPSLAGASLLETRFAFTVPYGLADDTAPPTLPPDPQWPYSRQAAGVWLDITEPEEPLGVMIVARG